MSIRLRIAFTFFFSLLFHLQNFSQECTLTSFLELGISNSPVLKDLSNQVQTNHFDSLITRAAFLPQVDFNGYLMYAPSVNGWGYSEVISNGQNLTGTLNVSQQLFNKKTKDLSLKKFGIGSGSLDNARQISLNDLKRAITAQYLAAFSSMEERNFQQDILSALKTEAVILKAWTEKGVYRQTDYLSFQVEIMNLERNIRDLDLTYRKESWNLNQICGMHDTTSCNLRLPELRDTLAPSVVNSIYFRKFMIDSLMIVNDRSLIDSRYKPVVKWFADGGIVNNEPRYLYQNFGISAGLSMTLPVFDGNQRKINYDRNRVSEDTRKNYQESFRLRYQSQISQLRTELEKTQALAKENEKQLSLVRELITADKAMLNEGSLPVTDYILALKSLFEAKHAGLQYQIRIQYVLNEINYWKQ